MSCELPLPILWRCSLKLFKTSRRGLLIRIILWCHFLLKNVFSFSCIYNKSLPLHGCPFDKEEVHVAYCSFLVRWFCFLAFSNLWHLKFHCWEFIWRTETFPFFPGDISEILSYMISFTAKIFHILANIFIVRIRIILHIKMIAVIWHMSLTQK